MLSCAPFSPAMRATRRLQATSVRISGSTMTSACSCRRFWCRLFPNEKDPEFLKAGGFLEKVEDFVFEGRTIKASRLGYRITSHFAERFLGRIFETPDRVFPEEMLRPEKQDLQAFAAGVDAIVESHKRVAQNYFDDRSVDAACPPLKALLHIMAHGSHEGRDIQHPEVRALFDSSQCASK